MKYLLLLLSIFLFLTSCKKDELLTKNKEYETKIEEKINMLYAIYGKSNATMYTQPISNNLFSPDLKIILEETVKAININNKTLRIDEKSLGADNNFFINAEGYSSYKIKSINLRENVKPSEIISEVEVEFENSYGSPKMIWTDKVRLINIHNREWQIDNIIFDNKKSSYAIDLKTYLKKITVYADSLNTK